MCEQQSVPSCAMGLASCLWGLLMHARRHVGVLGGHRRSFQILVSWTRAFHEDLLSMPGVLQIQSNYLFIYLLLLLSADMDVA